MRSGAEHPPLEHPLSRPAGRRAAWIEILAIALLPGVLGGTHLAGLLFFLNPQLPFTPSTVLRAVALYATLLGLVSVALHLPLTWRSRHRARGLLPWSITLVLVATGVGVLFHAAHYGYFLPAGMSRRLVKLGILVLTGAVIAFYTALVHRIRLRPYGKGTRILLVSIAIVSVYSAFERREAFKPVPASVPRATLVEDLQRPTLLVVGIDSATLDAVLPLAEVGRLPFLARMRAEGSLARLTSLHPVERVALWTTVATGVLPHKHSLVSASAYRSPFSPVDLRLLPLGIGFQHWGTTDSLPAARSASIERATLPQILARLGLRVATIGWPATAPAKREPAVVVTERFFTDEDARQGPGTVRPAELQERVLLFQPTREDLSSNSALPLDEEGSAVVGQALERDLWRADLGAFLLEQEPRIDAMFLVLPGLETVSRRYFGGYHMVRFQGALGEREARAAERIGAYYEFLDSTLARLWSLLPEPRLMLVVSAFGVDGPGGGRRLIGRLTGSPAISGRFDGTPDGVLMMLGEGLRPEMLSGEAKLVDIAPTALYGLGFPVANDLDGVVLTRAFEPAFLARRAISFIGSYENLAAQ